MLCPVCTKGDTKVIDSRVASDGLSIRRRRECVSCDFRFSTVESAEIMDLTVIKSDGRHEPYSRAKMERGLRSALEKRPHSTEDFRALVSNIECDIQRLRKGEVESSEIGEIVMERLRVFDSVAYIRFASVYRAFEDVETFREEVGRMMRKSKVGKKKA